MCYSVRLNTKEKSSVPIDPDKEEVVPLTDLAKMIPRSPSYDYATIRAWADQGRRSISGVVVKLEWMQMPWGRGTSWEAYQRFIKELNK